jgi:predicted GNAT family acetyltransferase
MIMRDDQTSPMYVVKAIPLGSKSAVADDTNALIVNSDVNLEHVNNEQFNNEFKSEVNASEKYMIKCGDQVAGFVTVGPQDVLNFFVKPEFRGKKLATKCVSRVMQHVQRPLVVKCDTTNVAARKVAQKLGFKLQAEDKNGCTYVFSFF